MGYLFYEIFQPINQTSLALGLTGFLEVSDIF